MSASWWDGEPATTEQIAIIRRDLESRTARAGVSFGPTVVRKLLAAYDRELTDWKRLRDDNAQLRERAEKAEAELKQLHTEYGIRADWISTRSSEGPVAETLGDALEALSEFDAKHGGRVVKRWLIKRKVGEWEVVDGG